MVQMGTLLAGKYRVECVLGQGGMGVVVRAMHLQLQQPVAVKFLLPEVLTNPEVVQRFLREAQAVVRLKSEHVARVFDVGSLEDGAPYMVFEYLDGSDLADFPRQRLTIGQIVDLLLQACEALAEAHAIGIVHRDIKPANFFITQRSDGSYLLKVLDFGISKVQQATLDGNLTAAATVMGTPAYMSPEQMKSAREVDNRSDIWALGIVLYELLEGAPPFAAETFGAMAVKVATEPLPPLAARLPAGLAEVVYQCLEKDPARRFQNVAELAHELAPYAQSTAQAEVSVERTSRVLGTDPPRPASTLRSSAGTIIRRPHSARRVPLLAGAVVVLVVIAAVTIVVVRGSDMVVERTPSTSPAASPSGSSDPPGRESIGPLMRPDAGVAVAPVPVPDAMATTSPPDAPPPITTTSNPPTVVPTRPSKPPGTPRQNPTKPREPNNILDIYH